MQRTGPEGELAEGYRPDIDGLRAIAVSLILLYHAEVPGITGGYVGVDVFFVISGFLITGLLLKELGRTGRLDLPAFYARRARRILPASLLVLAATIIGTGIFFSPVGFDRAVPALVSAALYVPNVLFASQVVDYFHPVFASPVVHYWSLGVEEQFYVVWPAFLLIGWRLARRRGPPLLAWVAAATALSLVLSLIATPAYPTQSFYLLPTRAWELGLGGVLAFAVQRLRALPPVVSNLAAVVGLAAIASSAMRFDASTQLPGWAAIVPVAGAALVIVAGGNARVGLPSAVLSTGILRYVGRISYSLYLWHWPLLVFARIALEDERKLVQVGVAMAATIALSAVTYRWVEDPLRHGRLVGRRTSRNLAAAGIASALVASLAIGGASLATQRFKPTGSPIAGIDVDPLAALIPATGPTADGPLPADIVPSVLDLHAGALRNDPVRDGCALGSGQVTNAPCMYGNADSTTEVVLFGDSHLGQWWPAIERLAELRDWRVAYLVKPRCTYADVTTDNPGFDSLTECQTWRAGVLERIAAERPALVIVSANHLIRPVVDGVVVKGEAANEVMGEAAERTIEALRARGAQVIVLGDIPQTEEDPADCLSSNPDHVLRCARPRNRALDLPWQALEQAIAERRGAVYVDVAAWACPSDPCPAILGRFVVYADTSHLTRPFVAALTSRLGALIP